MGVHTKLSIHVAAMKLLDAVTEANLQMRRDAKPSLGRKLIDESLDITSLIQAANMADDKVPSLTKVLLAKSRVEALLQVSLDKKLISTGLYAEASRWTTSVGQQAIGWRRSSQQRQLHGPQGGNARA